MDSVCIKGVSKADWLYFKSEAAKENKTMGDFFKTVLMKYRGPPKGNWDKILSHKPILTKEDAEAIRRYVNEEFKKDTEF